MHHLKGLDKNNDGQLDEDELAHRFKDLAAAEVVAVAAADPEDVEGRVVPAYANP